MPQFDIDSIAALARITIPEEDRAALSEDMAAILAFAADLPEAATDDAEQSVSLSDLREDTVQVFDPAPLLASAPALHEDAFTVPSGGIAL